ncbi:MAG TPA: Gfo/Idh/MocA family oxidoreductase [Bryobacteraceae bacterium]|nr:Gfo/Idh/MocA family oxidoreductase [Bryobacteraceae bacterium]
MPTTRRHFLGTAAGATLAGPLLAQQAAPVRSPNDHIQVALIGAGGQGMGDADNAARVPGVKLVAVSDCYDGRLARSKELWGNQLFTTRRYEEILARPDIDAVIVGTPDHWHQKISIDAMNAGKDVYCEKPMVQHIDDGAPVVETQRKTGRIMQVGSQRVSSIVYEKARELFRQGAIGQLNMVEAWWDRNSAIGAWEYSIAPDASPQTIDWDRFVGRAPKRSFDAERFFRWRCYRDYGTGVAGDLFVHLFSGMHYVTGAIGPERVYAVGGLRFWKDGRDVPDVLVGLYDYPETSAHPPFNLMLRVNFVDGGAENSGFHFIGSEGIMTIGDGVRVARHPRETEPGYTIDTFPKAIQEKFLAEYHAKYPPPHITAEGIQPDVKDQYRAPDDYSDHYDHISRFFTSVRSRKPVVENPVFGFRAAGPALLSNVSYFEERIVEWDPANMTVKQS